MQRKLLKVLIQKCYSITKWRNRRERINCILFTYIYIYIIYTNINYIGLTFGLYLYNDIIIVKAIHIYGINTYIQHFYTLKNDRTNYRNHRLNIMLWRVAMTWNTEHIDNSSIEVSTDILRVRVPPPVWADRIPTPVR